jgi:hypothetical protein
MIPPFIVGFAASPALGIIAALYTLAILIVQEYLIEPKIFRRNSYSAVILVLVILALVDAFGFVGLLLAPLLSATIQNIIKYLLPTTNAPEADKLPADAAGASAGSFRERLAQTKSSLRDFDPPHAPEIDSLVERLDLLILETELYSESQREVPQAIVSPRKLANR